MLNGRIVAVALSGAAFIACTNTEPSPPPDIETMSERARSGAPTRGASEGDGAADTAELEPEEPKAETAEEPLPGLPQTAPASGPAPSTSPLCGTGLTCSATNVAGSNACRQQASSIGDVHCCPHKGDRIVNGQCIPALCGTGLVCSSAPLTGASACRQYTTSTSNVYCCPSGQSIVNGKCQ